MKLPRPLVDALATSDAGEPLSVERVSGGDTLGGVHAVCTNGELFIKLAEAERADVLSAEANGLQELATAGAVRVPEVITVGRQDDVAWLATEWLPLERSTRASDALLGEQLAELHRTTAADYGFREDNWIGMSPQRNAQTSDWLVFFRENRLRFQLAMARDNGVDATLIDEGERLAESLHSLLGGHEPAASLLHGDLWGGNRAAVAGQPVIYDPAVYYGDRETDIAMTQLFGGFHESFLNAYTEAWPMPDGYEYRLELYRLYHILNHLNLFGSGYYAQALTSIRRLLAVI